MAKVLVVDDDHDNVRLLAYDLADEGYEVVSAYSGRQALDAADVERPDVILLDIMMPEMDGIEVCRRLKDDQELQHIPIIMVSAPGTEEDVIRGLDAGAMDYVTKPFSFPIVSARVRSAVRIKVDHDTIEEMALQLDAARRNAEKASHSKSEFLANMIGIRETHRLWIAIRLAVCSFHSRAVAASAETRTGIATGTRFTNRLRSRPVHS